MSRCNPASQTVLWLLWHAGCRFLPGARQMRARDLQLLRDGRGGARGTGVLTDHVVASVFEFHGLCGMPVSDVGGPAAEATCPSCVRIHRKATRR